MTKEINFYFDFISPYAYLAHKKIQLLPKDIKINYKPILLGGLHNLEGITAPAFIKPKLKHMINDCLLIAKKNNHDFKWNSIFPINSLNIMRGCFDINLSNRDLYIETMFNAYWKYDLDISKEEILITLLEQCKIDTDIFFKTIKDPSIKEKLKDATKNAHEKEVFGAPTFIVNNKIFWGQDRLEFALDEYNKID
ncbi:2-hydroxychromene-2-carboxylate isomerase [Candidatus Pelagibacter sp.]|nr:2-hydroxychromene-2-carboxylate isomerase [Candidatus Pelagibacter sp.]